MPEGTALNCSLLSKLLLTFGFLDTRREDKEKLNRKGVHICIYNMLVPFVFPLMEQFPGGPYWRCG